MHIMGAQFTPEAALGSLSLVFSIKYCRLVMHAHNHGEGGILASVISFLVMFGPMLKPTVTTTSITNAT
jgi:K+ transporter